MQAFFIVLARDGSEVERKSRELDSLGFPHLIVCGEKIDHPSVVFREPNGKYDAINFAFGLVPKDAEVVGLNDVDTKIHNLEAALHLLDKRNISCVFVRVDVKRGPQFLFYPFLDTIRRRILITGSGELMLIRRKVFEKILPLKKCKAEDSYILFRLLEYGHNVAFCEECYVTTKRTEHAKQEEDYKRRTVGGIYQALSMTNPPHLVKLFYKLLPFVSPLLLIMGGKGYYWAKGIMLGFVDYLRGDRTGIWKPLHVKKR